MQNPETGDFELGKTAAALLDRRDELLDAMDPAKRSSLQDERLWPVFKNGETVTVKNSSGAEALCVVESIGEKFIRLRGIPRQITQQPGGTQHDAATRV